MSPQPLNPHSDPIVDADAASTSDSHQAASERTDDSSDVLREAGTSNRGLPQRDRWSGEVQGACSTDPSVPAATESASLRESDHSQSLRSKLVLALALMLGVVVGIDEIVRLKVIAPEFEKLEQVAALKDTNRVFSAIDIEVEFLAERASHDVMQMGNDWHRLSEGHSQGQLSSETPTRLRRLSGRVEWAAIVSVDGEWTWLTTLTVDAAGQTLSPQSNRSQLDFPGVAQLVAHSDPVRPRGVQGMTRGSDDQLYLFAAIPLGRAGEVDEAAETDLFYVVGRRFGDQVVADLRQRTSVPFSIRLLRKGMAIQKQVEIAAKNSSILHVQSPLASPSGQVLAELNVQLPREVTNRSNRTTAFARYLSLCGACASLLLLLLFLQRIVIGRLEKIRQHTERIAQSGIISEASAAPVLRVAGHDEIGQLAQSFDRMRNRLGDAQRRLSDASHAAGMSLVADTVIHNVGNVLTNVNSLLETATRRVESLRIEPLEKLADRLRSDDVDQQLQKATPDYLTRLSETLEQDKGELAALLQTLNDNIQHIHQVIRDQRRHAHQPIKWVALDLGSVIAEAAKCSQARLAADNVHVEFKCDQDVRVWTDRSLLLQILINIIGNAGNATRHITSRQPTLKIDLIRAKSTVLIRFRDNGCGMDEQTIARVFDAHFTTRQSGSGLGLHFCAIAMKRIAGSIHAESDGPDMGATFSVEVPIEEPSTDRRSEASVADLPSEGDDDRDSVRAKKLQCAGEKL